jgi:glucose-1-phosphate thymidylyltransferase
LTTAVNKHLLPIGNKPMIARVMQTMLEAGVKQVLIVTNPEHLNDFAVLTSSDEQPYNQFDCIYFVAQKSPRGIADAVNYGYDFLKGDESFFVLLGDTLVSGGYQFRAVINTIDTVAGCKGAHIWTYRVDDPSDYGVLKLNDAGDPVDLIEKPKEYVSNLAVPGIYLLDCEAWWQLAKLKPSDRGELEITDLLRLYLARGKLHCHELQGDWADPGRSVDHYYNIATMMFKD